MTVQLADLEMLKGVRLHMGTLPAGARCEVAYSEDGRSYRMAWYDVDPLAAGVQGFGFNEWPAARWIKITLHQTTGKAPIGWDLRELEVFAEE